MCPPKGVCFSVQPVLNVHSVAPKTASTGLHPPLTQLANSDNMSNSRKWLCASSQVQLPDGGITCIFALWQKQAMKK